MIWIFGWCFDVLHYNIGLWQKNIWVVSLFCIWYGFNFFTIFFNKSWYFQIFINQFEVFIAFGRHVISSLKKKQKNFYLYLLKKHCRSQKVVYEKLQGKNIRWSDFSSNFFSEGSLNVFIATYHKKISLR